MGGYFAVVSTTTSPDASTTVARAPDVPKSRPRKRSPSASADVRCSEDDAVAVVVAAAAAAARVGIALLPSPRRRADVVVATPREDGDVDAVRGGDDDDGDDDDESGRRLIRRRPPARAAATGADADAGFDAGNEETLADATTRDVQNVSAGISRDRTWSAATSGSG
jgi:hypothetical protein